MKRLFINAVILGAMLVAVSCESRSERTFRLAQEEKVATEVVNESAENIIIETLHKGSLNSGIYKITIDKHEYIVVDNRDGTSIVKHN